MKKFVLTGRRGAVLAALWLAFVLFGCARPQAAAIETELSNELLQLVFDPSQGVVRHWYLRGIDDAAGGTRDLAAPAGAQFALRGTLGGVELAEWERRLGGWAVHRQSADSLSLTLRHPEGLFAIEKHWRLAEGPWRADFRLSVAVPGLEPRPDDRLWLELGPGLGEIPAHGLGVAQSMYSFTEVVGRSEQGVNTWRLAPGAGTASSAGDGVGLQSRYFALMLIAEPGRPSTWSAELPAQARWYPEAPAFETRLRIGIDLPPAGADAPATYRWQVFGGGKAYHALTVAEPDLGGLLFPDLWNWMRALTLGIMRVLGGIQALVGSWGVAIILLAVLVRVAMHPIAKRAMAAQRRFVAAQGHMQPELDEIKRNYKGGEQSERILQLYERHGISPFGGLKPLLIVMLQIPIFIALYHLLGQAFELRSAPFLWMDTLAEPDQLFAFGRELPFFGAYFNLLPALMALTTMASIKLSPAPAADKRSSVRQNVMLGGMAMLFFLLFYTFPSGMVLYWTMANFLHLLHGLWAGRHVETRRLGEV